jgi:NAD(P)-dependent dehydrogenase (short-subunit alcohol dehydrogenase family)
MTYETLSLAGKVAIVTGSGRENGIGAAIAAALARNGASVTINHVSDSSAPRAAAVVKNIEAVGGRAIVVKADVGTKQGANFIVSETLKEFETNHIDILGTYELMDGDVGAWSLTCRTVNNAAVGLMALTLDTTEEQLNDVFAANVNGPFFAVQETVPHMPPGGRIVNISSIAAKMGMAYCAAYGATKAALDSMTYTWAEEVS